MKPRCTICGKHALYKCKYCGDTLCKEHLPPRKHWCIGLEQYEKDFRDGKIIARPIEGRKKRSLGRFFAIFSKNYSYLLLFLISLSFILQLLIPGYTNLLILDPLHIKERPWTLITSIFLHGDFNHFFFNMLFFLFFAPVLERKVGSLKFLLIFFLSGIVAGIGYSLTSVRLALGASGALYGIFGALAVLKPRMKVYFFFFIPMEIWMVVVLFAGIDFLMIPSGDMIAHTAHLSGLFVGLLAGASLKEGR